MMPYVEIIRDSTQLKQYFGRMHRYDPPPVHDILIASGMITEEQYRFAMADPNRDQSQHIAFYFRHQGLITDDDLGHILGRCFGIPYVNLHDFDIDISTLQSIPVEFARKNAVMPLLSQQTKLVIAVADPTNNTLMETLHFITGKQIELAVSTYEDIMLAVSTYYSQDEIAKALQTVDVLSHEPGDTPISEKALERPVVQLVQNLIAEAVMNRASDIHIRPRQNAVEIYFRVDGQLVHQRSFSKQLLAAISSRLKIFGGMDISEHRVPQDGRARIRFGDKEIDLRLSIMPGIYGEDVVIRLLDSQFAMKHLEDLGYEGDDAERIRHLLSRNNGMFLVTGPTGSGKSTTLYTAIEQIRSDSINIITVEDPVEYRMDGITQIQINNQTGYTFARALKHILRHDPDVIMLGEIRDEETAKMAVESALTGHLVLSTLHTNSAATTITRFLEIGVESYLLSSTLLGVLAQRLVRSNCSNCLIPEEVSPGVRKVMGVADDEVFYKGGGCEYCKYRGTKGRRAAYELLVMTPGMRNLLQPGVQADTLQQLAVQEGMTPLTEHALHLARQGLTSLQEAYNMRLE